jgi:hypothetical protein
MTEEKATTKNRMQKWMIPDKPSLCEKTQCPYDENSVCLQPRTNKGNSDAHCHRENIKDLVARLIKIEETRP